MRYSGLLLLPVIIWLLWGKSFVAVEKGLSRGHSEYSFSLVESSKASGIVHTHIPDRVHSSLKNVEPWLTGIGASVSVTDIDQDGFQDIYLCNNHVESSNLLYINNRDGTFTEKAGEYNLGRINSPHPCMRPIFFDFDNDGLKDLFWVTTFCPRLFRQVTKGNFKEVTQNSGLADACVLSFSSNVIDYNRDGFLDLIISGYFPAVDLDNPGTTRVMHENIIGAQNGGPTYIFKNNGNGTFSDVTQELKIAIRGWGLVTAIYDLNYDMWPEIWFGMDFNKNKVFLNQEGKFKNISSSLSLELSRSGMGVDFEDIDNDRKPVAYISQIYEPQNAVKGNQFFKFFNSQKIVDQAESRDVLRCGWAWGNKFIDLDNDGDSEILVANGFFSGDPDKSYWYHLSQINSTNEQNMPDARNWHDMNGYTLAGYQRNCLFLNQNNTFKDISRETALGEYKLDSRAVAIIDSTNNGSLDFIVTNQRQQTLLFSNAQKNGNNWIGFRLISRGSANDGYGAIVTVSTSRGSKTRQNYFNNGFTSQSDPRVHFGLQRQSEVTAVEVHWPSGKTSRRSNLQINRYHDIYE